jgi:hypothetical protein
MNPSAGCRWLDLALSLIALFTASLMLEYADPARNRCGTPISSAYNAPFSRLSYPFLTARLAMERWPGMPWNTGARHHLESWAGMEWDLCGPPEVRNLRPPPTILEPGMEAIDVFVLELGRDAVSIAWPLLGFGYITYPGFFDQAPLGRVMEQGTSQSESALSGAPQCVTDAGLRGRVLARLKSAILVGALAIGCSVNPLTAAVQQIIGLIPFARAKLSPSNPTTLHVSLLPSTPGR